MSLTLTILLSLLSAGILAGRVYEILNLTDASTGFLLVNGIIMNPYILGIFAVITLCCGILIFGSYKTVKPYYSKSSKYTAALAGAAFAAAGVLSLQYEAVAPFFIAGGAAFVIMAITDLGKKNTDIVVMLLMLAFAAGMCMDVVSFNVSTYHNTVFIQNVLEYLCISVFMLVVVKNVYMPSKYSRMFLYVTGIFAFAVCSMMNIADIICYVMNGGQSVYQLVICVATALFGIFAFDTAVSAIPAHKETKKGVEEQQKKDVIEDKENTETAEAENTEPEKSEISPAEVEMSAVFAQSELEQMFDAFAEEKAESAAKSNETSDTAVEVVLKEERENDVSRYTMVSELFGAQTETEITAELTQSVLGETRSFKKFSQPKLEESAPEYDMLKSMFKGEDTSHYQFDAEDDDVKQNKKQSPSKQKRSLFGGKKKEKVETDKTAAEKVSEENVSTEKSVIENMPSENINKKEYPVSSKQAKSTGKTKFAAAETRSDATKTQAKKIVYKKPK